LPTSEPKTVIVDESQSAQEAREPESAGRQTSATEYLDARRAQESAGAQPGVEPAAAIRSELHAAPKPLDAVADAPRVAPNAATTVAAVQPAARASDAGVEKRDAGPSRDAAPPDSQAAVVRDAPVGLTTLLKLYAWSLIPPVLFAGAYLLLLLAVLAIPMAWTSTTVSIDAIAEVFRFDVAREKPAESQIKEPREAADTPRNALDDRFSILLPAGTYSLADASGIEDCPAVAQPDSYFRLCGYSEPTTLRVRGAHMRFSLVDQESRDETNRVARTTRLAIRVTPPAVAGSEAEPAEDESVQNAIDVQVVGGGEKPLFRTGQWIEFESDPITYWRAPLQITNVTIGESLSELNPTQRILVDGSVRFFSRGKPWDGDPNRHLVYSEKFDRADSVTVAQSEEAVVGLVSFEASTSEPAARPSAFDLVLHANRSGVEVERLGAKHAVTASVWMQLPPVWTAFWTVFSALTAVIGLRKYGRSAAK
jgi:hypothetical protein